MAKAKQEEIKTLLEAGAHFGHRTSRWNPKMRPFIYTERDGIHIIDLVQTEERLQEAADFAQKTAAAGKQVLFVGTKKHIAPVIAEVAGEADMPYVIGRWFGGILTNFDTILRRIKYFKKLSQQLDDDELNETYNKREVAKFQEEREKMAESFTGLANMEELPGAVFISDVNNEKTAIREANRLQIPVIAIVDSNGDPGPVDYVIPANDDAVKTVSLITRRITEAITAGNKERTAATSKTKTKSKSASTSTKSASIKQEKQTTSSDETQPSEAEETTASTQPNATGKEAS